MWPGCGFDFTRYALAVVLTRLYIVVTNVDDTIFSESEIRIMRVALEQASLAYAVNEIPVGAVITTADGDIIATGFNRTITDRDPTAHAEIVALRQAAVIADNYRLPGLSMFVTLEPCAMCMGAMLHARLSRVVYGASDPKTGACASVLSLQSIPQLNHQTAVTGGLLANECGEVLRQFFRQRRALAK